MNKNDLVMAKLNMLTILEFTQNYNKSEMERFFVEDTEEMKRTQKEIKEILESDFDAEKYDIKVNNNFVEISEIINKTETSITTRSIKKIFSENFNHLPYAYVMGRKISKKNMENALKNMV
ncbi:MAG: hypothetical protein IJH20_06715 [Bacilli bacterium]|nr:hypothetical protein [Bacilli bacterium]